MSAPSLRWIQDYPNLQEDLEDPKTQKHSSDDVCVCVLPKANEFSLNIKSSTANIQKQDV